jgi:hypothetical protein
MDDCVRSTGSLSGQFHLNLVGKPGRTVVVEASSNLADWTPTATNDLNVDMTAGSIEIMGERSPQPPAAF